MKLSRCIKSIKSLLTFAGIMYLFYFIGLQGDIIDAQKAKIETLSGEITVLRVDRNTKAYQAQFLADHIEGFERKNCFEYKGPAQRGCLTHMFAND